MFKYFFYLSSYFSVLSIVALVQCTPANQFRKYFSNALLQVLIINKYLKVIFKNFIYFKAINILSNKKKLKAKSIVQLGFTNHICIHYVSINALFTQGDLHTSIKRTIILLKHLSSVDSFTNLQMSDVFYEKITKFLNFPYNKVTSF